MPPPRTWALLLALPGLSGLACDRAPTPPGRVVDAPASPGVVLDAPAEGAHSRTHMVLVRGSADGVEELFLNSARIPVRPDGTFEHKLELLGPHAEIVARDGKRPDAVLLVRRVTIDLEAPMLELVDLPGEIADGALYRRGVAQDRVLLRGRATDSPPGEIASVTIADAPCAVAADGGFELAVDAPKSGERTLEVAARDRAGNRARIVLTLVRR